MTPSARVIGGTMFPMVILTQATKGLTPEKASPIKKAHCDQAGSGRKTLQEVKKLEEGTLIRFEYAEAWFNKKLSQKAAITHYNSYVAQEPKQRVSR